MTNIQSGRDALVRQFWSDGMNIIFGNPGSTESGLLDALEEFAEEKRKQGSEGIRYILGLHETAVIGMADAYARATRKPTLVQVHAPAGLGNSIGMIYQANQGFSPLIIVCGSSGVKYDTMKGLLSGDQVRMAETVTKWAGRASTPSSLLRLARNAVKIATTPPQKPVFLELPMDILDAPSEGEIIPTTTIQVMSTPSEEVMQQVAEILLNAKKPHIIVGDGISIAEAQKELAELAEIIGAKVFGAFNHEVNISYKNMLYQGVLGWNNGNEAHNKVRDADAVLVCGTRLTTQLFPYIGDLFPVDAMVVHISGVAEEIIDNYPIDLGITCDPKIALGMLVELVTKGASSEYKADAKERAGLIKAETQLQWMKEVQQDESEAAGNFHVSVFMKTFAEMMPEDTVIFDEAITNSATLVRYVQPDRPGSYYLLRGGVLGAGVAGTVGLALAKPEQIVVGFIGDGASMFSIHALWTAARYDLNAKFVICNNRSYRILKINMQKYWKTSGQEVLDSFPPEFNLEIHDIRSSYEEKGQLDNSIDFVSLAKSFGVPAIRVDSVDDVQKSIIKLLNTHGPFLIDLILEQDVEIADQDEQTHCGQ